MYNDHPWDQEKVVDVPKWSLFRGSSCQSISIIKKLLGNMSFKMLYFRAVEKPFLMKVMKMDENLLILETLIRF